MPWYYLFGGQISAWLVQGSRAGQEEYNRLMRIVTMNLLLLGAAAGLLGGCLFEKNLPGGPPDEPDGPFTCRDLPFSEQSAETVDYSLSVYDLIGWTPRPDLTIQACQSLDSICELPVDEATTDIDGDFTLSLPIGFRGRLFIPQQTPDLAPLSAPLFPPPTDDPAVPPPSDLTVTSLEVLEGVGAIAGVSTMLGNGHMFFSAIDCLGASLSGVTVTPSVQTPETLVVYLGTSGQPDLSLAGTGELGMGIILNVPTGFVTVSGIHENEGLLFEQSVLVASDTITSVPIVPSPTQ